MKKVLIFILFFLPYYGFSQSDIGVSKIISPIGTSNVYDSTFITVQVHNYGLASMDTLPFEVKVIGVSFYDTVFLPQGLLPSDSLIISLNTWYNSPIGLYPLEILTNLSTDINPSNDGAKRVIYGYFNSQPIDLSLEDIFIGNDKQEAGQRDSIYISVLNSGQDSVSSVDIEINYNATHNTFTHVFTPHWLLIPQRIFCFREL
jgi:hypothetical protein